MIIVQRNLESSALCGRSLHIVKSHPQFFVHVHVVPLFFQGILAAQLTALQGLVDEGCTDIGLLYVVSEETDHSGMIAANELGLNPEYMIVGEPTDSKMM